MTYSPATASPALVPHAYYNRKMAECPICGLGGRCRNHWVASQDAAGEIQFQTGPMTASDDNLILLQNKLGRPDLKTVMAKIGLDPHWVELPGQTLAYLAWPLDFRAAVNRALFPVGPPGGEKPVPAVPTFRHSVEDITLSDAIIDTDNCLPDELLYHVDFGLQLMGFGMVQMRYSQVLWDELLPWGELMHNSQIAAHSRQTLILVFSGLLDSLRASFVGQVVDVLAENQEAALIVGSHVDEVARLAPPELHLGEEIENLVNQRRLQPMLRTAIGGFALAAKL